MWENVCEGIRHIKLKHCILSTDLGRPEVLYPDEGIQILIKNLLSQRFSPDDIKQMKDKSMTFLVENE